MVIGATAWMALAVTSAQAPGGDRAPRADDANREVAKALAKEKLRWYDEKQDALAPVQPPWTPSWWDRLPNWTWSGPSGSINFGQVIVFIVFVAALALLIAGLIWAYRNYVPAPTPVLPRTSVGTAAAIGGLPAGLDVDLSDPLAAARELRARGDLAGAIIALFVHQVLTLDRLRLARLMPGRTGRQLVRAVSDAWVRTRIEPTLRLFEAAFYGRRAPDPQAFERAWSLAEEWEARIAQGATVS